LPRSGETGQLTDAWHNPRTALLLGLVVPGSGYLYSRDWLLAYPAFGVSVSGMVIGAMIYGDSCDLIFGPCHESVPVQHQIGGGLLMAGAAAVWIASARDASDRVRRRSAANRRAPPMPPGDDRLVVTPFVGGSAERRVAERIGVNISW
jgi:hypothetical protein